MCFATLCLSACGGGGSGNCGSALLAVGLIGCGDNSSTNTPAPSGKSITQNNFELAALSDTLAVFDWSQTSPSAAPTYMYYDLYSTPASPALGSQTAVKTLTPVSSPATLPNISALDSSRILKSGVIYYKNHDSKMVWSYAGADVVATNYATDSVTVLASEVYDSWSAPIPLTGAIATATLLNSFLSFTKLTNSPKIFDFYQSWLNGAKYFKVTAYQKTDTLYVLDWPVQPANQSTKIEDLFATQDAKTNGGITLDGVVYALEAGTMGSIEGSRAWIANTKRPSSTFPTDAYSVIFELGGKLYLGSFIKAGTRKKWIDRVDSTLINDYTIVLNATAATSIAQAATFAKPFPLQAAYKQYQRKWLDGNFTASRTCTSALPTNYQYTFPPAIDASFNGQAALAQTPVQVGGQTVQYTRYYDPITLNFLGNRDLTPGATAYMQVISQPALPQYIKVGDSGTLYVAGVYSGTTKTNQETQTYQAVAISDSNYLEFTLTGTYVTSSTGKTMGLTQDVFWLDRLGNLIVKSHKSTDYDIDGAVTRVCTMTTSNSL